MNQELVTGLADWFGVPVPVASALLLAAALAWVWWRTGSVSFIFARLWQLLGGQSADPASEAGKFMARMAGVDEFRVRYGTQVATPQQLEALLGLLAARDLEVQAVSRCGGFFDPKTLKVRERLPGLVLRLIMFFGAVALSFAIMLSATLVVVHRPVITIKATGTDVVLWEDSAKALWKPHRVRLSECTSGVRNASGFTDAEHAVLCEVLASPLQMKQAKGDLGLQTGLLILLIVVLAVPTYAGLIVPVRYTAARDLARRLSEPLTVVGGKAEGGLTAM